MDDKDEKPDKSKENPTKDPSNNGAKPDPDAPGNKGGGKN